MDTQEDVARLQVDEARKARNAFLVVVKQQRRVRSATILGNNSNAANMLG